MRTALMVASGFAESEIVDLLLSEGAHVDAKDIQGRTALMYAAGHNQERTKNTDVVERLILEGANIETQDEGGRTSLMYAVRRCNLYEAELLLGKGADPLLTDSDGRTIFELDIQYQANLFETDYYERDSQKNCQQLAALLAEVKATLAPEEVNGKDSYYDVTCMVTPGENTITYYHFTDGPGIGVKVRIHRKV